MMPMLTYFAIVEEGGPEFAVGVWFPDVPCSFSAGDTVDEAIVNAREALALHLEDFLAEGRPYPTARTITELRRDPAHAADIKDYLVALIPFEPPVRAAA